MLLENFQSFSYASDVEIDRDAFCSLLSKLPKEIIRAKGFLKTPEGGLLVNYVFGRFEFEPFLCDKNEIVFIGLDALDHKDKVIKEIKATEVAGS